jgi:hypothetical protein
MKKTGLEDREGLRRGNRVDSEKVLAKYVDAIIANKKALNNADPKTANKHYKVLVKSLHQLEAVGERREALLSLLSHEIPDVRGVAAAHLIDIEPKRAVYVLEELAKSGGVAGFEANMVLKLWREGKFHIP